jgi:hypothetical protein
LKVINEGIQSMNEAYKDALSAESTASKIGSEADRKYKEVSAERKAIAILGEQALKAYDQAEEASVWILQGDTEMVDLFVKVHGTFLAAVTPLNQMILTFVKVMKSKHRSDKIRLDTINKLIQFQEDFLLQLKLRRSVLELALK